MLDNSKYSIANQAVRIESTTNSRKYQVLPLAATTPRAARVAVLVVGLLLLHKVLGEGTEDSTAERAKNTVVGFLAKVVTGKTSTEGAEKTSV